MMSPSVSSSPVTYARPRPNSPGAHSMRLTAVGERTMTVPGPSRGPRALPSQNSKRTGNRLLNSACRSGATAAAALGPARLSALRCGHAMQVHALQMHAIPNS